MLGVAPLLSTVLCWKNHLFSSEGQFISSVKMQVATFPTKTTVCPGHMTPCGLTGQLRGLKIRCSLINAGPKSVRHPSSGGGNRLQVHLSPSNWQKNPKTNSKHLQGAFCLVCQTLGVPGFRNFTQHLLPLQVEHVFVKHSKQGRQEAEMNLFLSSRRSSSAPVLPAKKIKKILKKGGGGGGRGEWGGRENVKLSPELWGIIMTQLR